MSLALQYLAVALAVLASAWVVARRQFPGAVRRLRIAMALPMVRDTRPEWLRRIGRRIAPAATIANAACGGCDGCSPGSP